MDTDTTPSVGVGHPHDSPEVAYNRLARSYDAYSVGVNYNEWLEIILDLYAAISTRQLPETMLDVAAGTGTLVLQLAAAQPTIEVAGCDISPGMIDVARQKAMAMHLPRPGVEFFVADMRALPPGGPVDLITCTDDALNYLASAEELVSTFRAFATRLSPGGLCIVDLALYRTFLESTGECEVFETDDWVFVRHELEHTIPRGGWSRVALTSISRDPSRDVRDQATHRQRHFPLATIRDAIAAADLTVVHESGPNPESGRMESPLDELVHPRGFFVASRPS